MYVPDLGAAGIAYQRPRTTPMQRLGPWAQQTGKTFTPAPVAPKPAAPSGTTVVKAPMPVLIAKSAPAAPAYTPPPVQAAGVPPVIIMRDTVAPSGGGGPVTVSSPEPVADAPSRGASNFPVIALVGIGVAVAVASMARSRGR